MSTYTAKYELGQLLAGITSYQVDRLVRCATCKSTGFVKIGEEEFLCPKCNGRAKHPQYAGLKWLVDVREAPVASIEIRHRDGSRMIQDPELEVRYMLESSLGGRLWREQELYPSREEAQAECDRRNRVVNFQDEE